MISSMPPAPAFAWFSCWLSEPDYLSHGMVVIVGVVVGFGVAVVVGDGGDPLHTVRSLPAEACVTTSTLAGISHWL